MPLDIETFKDMKGKKTNLDLIIGFLEKDGRAWSVSELASELNLDPAIISQISKKHDGKELVRKQDGRRVWIALKEGGISMETGEKAKDLKQLINDFLDDTKAQDAVKRRNLTCENVRTGLHDNITADEFQELIKSLRGERNSVRDRRFGNRINTQEKVDILLDALGSATFEDAAKKIADVEGIGIDGLSMMLHIKYPDKYHCVNGQAIRVIDRMIEKGLLEKEPLHRYVSCKGLSGIQGFVNAYNDYERILNKIQSMGKMTKSQTDFFIGWVDHDIRRRYSLGDMSLSGL
jgi:DNA-binding MarR family transcriptional regulator